MNTHSDDRNKVLYSINHFFVCHESYMGLYGPYMDLFYDSFPKNDPLTTHQEYIGKVPMGVHFKSVIFMTRKDVFTI